MIINLKEMKLVNNYFWQILKQSRICRKSNKYKWIYIQRKLLTCLYEKRM